MKKNDIIKVLKANKKISDYELTIINKDSRELFYVLDHLEINRAVKIDSATIKVYVADKKSVGSSMVMLTAADDEKSLAKKLNGAVIRARSARNQYYPLAEKTVNIKEERKNRQDLNLIASKVAEAVLKADHYRNGWINSTEIFVSSIKEELINSKGIDHVSDYFKIEIECIPTWSNKKEEFELYKFYQSNRIDYKQITEEITEILELAKARSQALTIKDVDLPDDLMVLVKNDMLEEIVDNFTNDLSYRNVFMKENHYSINDVLSENKFDLTMKPCINGCLSSHKYDSHGVVLKPKILIRKVSSKTTMAISSSVIILTRRTSVVLFRSPRSRQKASITGKRNILSSRISQLHSLKKTPDTGAVKYVWPATLTARNTFRLPVFQLPEISMKI